jgi:hypothetical protein
MNSARWAYAFLLQSLYSKFVITVQFLLLVPISRRSLNQNSSLLILICHLEIIITMCVAEPTH